ncbi:MAG: hypothetical protein ACK4ON_03660, partial [Bacteroidia bacterium]
SIVKNFDDLNKKYEKNFEKKIDSSINVIEQFKKYEILIIDTLRYVEKLKDPDSECYIPSSNFSPNINVNCETTCEECTASVGTKSEYIIKSLKGVYTIPLDNNAFFSINSSLQVTVTAQPTDSTINFGQPIIQAEVDAFVIRFIRDWEVINQACEQLCGVPFASGCSVSEKMLLADVSPNGQYGFTGLSEAGITGVNPAVLSLFNQNNQIVYNNETL